MRAIQVVINDTGDIKPGGYDATIVKTIFKETSTSTPEEPRFMLVLTYQLESGRMVWQYPTLDPQYPGQLVNLFRSFGFKVENGFEPPILVDTNDQGEDVVILPAFTGRMVNIQIAGPNKQQKEQGRTDQVNVQKINHAEQFSAAEIAEIFGQYAAAMNASADDELEEVDGDDDEVEAPGRPWADENAEDGEVEE